MTYFTHEMNGEKNQWSVPWPAGTFRVFFNDYRQYWGISNPFDRYRGNCFMYWPKIGGEFFDGRKWRPMTEYQDWTASKDKPKFKII